MTDTAVKTSALEAGIKSLAVVGDRLNKLVADGRLDDDRDVIGEIATAMTNVRTEVAAISRKLDVVQREAQQREYERDVALQLAKDAEALQKQSAADGRTTMQLMAVGCVVACLATGFAARWWYAPGTAVVDRAPSMVGPAPVPMAAGRSGPLPGAADGAQCLITAPQGSGDYARAFGYAAALGCR